ncbi:hypothetical protein CYMTET_16887 [Cymbomonas tetramitiformis]|uniref:Uncharacterized protein n=1 Tax=Cymbomonas tetramitiformis TaxID=36881 RepID=A0AAE0GBB6_9CHLO|nr:hypothetical protein CYMTET_16887 [Cymbomonas tetramitiformis]
MKCSLRCASLRTGLFMKESDPFIGMNSFCVPGFCLLAATSSVITPAFNSRPVCLAFPLFVTSRRFELSTRFLGIFDDAAYRNVLAWGFLKASGQTQSVEALANCVLANVLFADEEKEAAEEEENEKEDAKEEEGEGEGRKTHR